MAKKALITGVTGQDGSYLSELLLEKGYEVYGLTPRFATDPFENIQHLLDRVQIVTGDLTDSASLYRVMTHVEPDEVYNLGAQSFVKASWEMPELTGDVTGVGDALVGSDSPDTTRCPFLPGVEFGNVWQGLRDTTERENTISSAQSLWGGESVRSLGNGELSREL